MLSERENKLEHVKMRKKQCANPKVEEKTEETENGDNTETEKTENDKITELEEQLEVYRLEYASTLLEKVGIGGKNYHALNLIDMTSKDTIKEDVERLVEICENYNTGTYSSNIHNSTTNIGNNEIKTEDDLMQRTFGTGKWRGKPWL